MKKVRWALLCGLAVAAGCVSTAFGKATRPLAGRDQQPVEAFGWEDEIGEMIDEQLRLEETCVRIRSRHAHTCREGTVMLFVQTMESACSPVGCFDVGGATEDAIVHEVSLDGQTVRRRWSRGKAGWIEGRGGGGLIRDIKTTVTVVQVLARDRCCGLWCRSLYMKKPALK